MFVGRRIFILYLYVDLLIRTRNKILIEIGCEMSEAWMGKLLTKRSKGEVDRLTLLWSVVISSRLRSNAFDVHKEIRRGLFFSLWTR